MAKGWSIDDYNRQIFGQKVGAYRLILGWSHGYFHKVSGINRGTLLHVEKGEVHLPDAKRQKIIDVLIEALQQSGQSVNRQELLKLAGLPTASSAVLSTVSSTPQLLAVEIPGASGQEKSFHDRPHEEYAELLNQQQEWQLAGTFWLLAAQEAKHSGNWAKWSRCLLHAGLMALTCGQFEVAERRFKEVMDKSQDEVAPLAVAEASIRLGWLYYEQDQFSQARQALLHSRTLLQNAASKKGSLHFPEHGSILVHEGREVIKALESTRLHWLGRTCVDWGIEQGNQQLIREGLARLQKGGDYDSELGLYGNVGFALLRQIPALLHVGELDTAENYLARSEELLGTRGALRGHISLHKGLLALEEQTKKAKDFLESAREGFVEPIVYSRGLSEVFKEMSGVYLMDDKKTEDEVALQYALAATVLHPYGRNVELLQLAAHKMYWRMGENRAAFNTLWQALEEKLWSMESEPFTDLRYFVKSFQGDGVSHVEAAMVKARKAIQHELFRK